MLLMKNYDVSITKIITETAESYLSDGNKVMERFQNKKQF